MSVQRTGRFDTQLDIADYRISNSTGISTKSGDLKLNPFTNNVLIPTGKKIKYEVSPVSFTDDDLIPKSYVDSISQGFVAKDGCRVITLTNLDVTAAGSGNTKTLTANANGVAVLDGVTLAVDDRVLVAGQTNKVDNGIYFVQNAGSVSTAYVLKRDVDADVTSELNKGAHVFILEGSNLNTGWVLQGPFGSFVLDDPVNGEQYWVIFSRAGQALGEQLVASGVNSANVYKETTNGKLRFRNITSTAGSNPTNVVEFNDSGNNVLATIDTTKITSLGQVTSGSIASGFGGVEANYLQTDNYLNFNGGGAIRYNTVDYLTFNGVGVSAETDFYVSDAYVDTQAVSYAQVNRKSAKDGVVAILTGSANYEIIGAALQSTAITGVVSADFDNYSAQLNDRVLVRDFATASRNGIYTIQAVAPRVVLARTIDADTIPKLNKAHVVVHNGTIYKGSAWSVHVSQSGMLDTTAITVERLFLQSDFDNLVIANNNGYLTFPDSAIFKIKSTSTDFLTFNSTTNVLTANVPVDLTNVYVSSSALLFKNTNNNSDLLKLSTDTGGLVEFMAPTYFRQDSAFFTQSATFYFAKAGAINYVDFRDDGENKSFIFYDRPSLGSSTLELGNATTATKILNSLQVPGTISTGNASTTLTYGDNFSFADTFGSAVELSSISNLIDVYRLLQLRNDLQFLTSANIKVAGVNYISVGSDEVALQKNLVLNGANVTSTGSLGVVVSNNLSFSSNGANLINNDNTYINVGSSSFPTTVTGSSVDLYGPINVMTLNDSITYNGTLKFVDSLAVETFRLDSNSIIAYSPVSLNALQTNIATTHVFSITDSLDIKQGSNSYVKVDSTAQNVQVTSLKLTASLNYNVASISTDTTLNATHNVVNVTTGASDIVITLPDATSNTGRVYKIAKVDSGVGRVLVRRSGTDLIDGTASDLELLSQYDHTGVISHGVSWLIH